MKSDAKNPHGKPALRLEASVRSATVPFVLVNMAMTADGKIATANRGVSSFGSRRDAKHLLELRSTSDAVMAGARTVSLNNINLGPGGPRYRRLRRVRGLAEYNLRIIVSGNGQVDMEAEVFKKRFSPVVVLVSGAAPAERVAKLRTIATEVKVCGNGAIDFRAALAWLRQKWGVRRLVCEGGGELNDALFRAGLVNELHLTVCPLIFGGRSAPTISDGTGAERLVDASNWKLQSARRVGDELFLVYARATEAGLRAAGAPLPRGRAAKASPKGG